jgi:hypothetical protein
LICIIVLIKEMIMKKIINRLLRMFFVLTMPFYGAKSENKPVIEMVTSEDIAVLKDIVKFAAKVMRGKNALFAQERIQDLMNKLDPAIQEKIVDDIKIIIKIGDPYQVVSPKSLVVAAPKRMKESMAAYRNLGHVVEIIEAQTHLIKVAQEAKELVENVPADEKSGVINFALKKIQGATQAAKKSVDRLYSSVENKLKLSEDNVFKRINLLREIVVAASLLAKPEDRKIIFLKNYKDKEIREEGKKILVRLMRSNLLNGAIRDTITPDIQILLDTTDETLDVSQKAYERLRDIVEGAEKEEKSIIAMIKEGKELVQKAPLGTLQKVSEFVTVQMLNVGELLEDLLKQGARSVTVGSRNLLGGYGLADVLTYPTTERKFLFLSNISSLCEQICAEKKEHFKQELENLMKDPLLDAEIKNAVTADVQIVLDTTDDTMQESKAACQRLRVLAETYKPYFRKAIAMMGNFIGFGWSKMKDLMESVKTFVYNHPIASTVISAYVLRRLIATFNSYVAHYKYFKEDSMYYDEILKKAGDAFREGDLNTYYTLVGILQDLGITITEKYDKNIPKGLFLEYPH